MSAYEYNYCSFLISTIPPGGDDQMPSREMDAVSNEHDDSGLQMPEITTSIPPHMEAASYVRQAREKEKEMRKERDAIRQEYSSSGKVYTSGEKMPVFMSDCRPSCGSEGCLSSGGGSEGGRKISSDGDKKSPDTLKWSASLKSSSRSPGRKVLSSSLLFRDEDPTYVPESFNLYLDMEVFNTDMAEHYKMAFKVRVLACMSSV